MTTAGPLCHCGKGLAGAKTCERCGIHHHGRYEMCEDCRLVEKPTACERRPAKIEGILEMAIATGAKEFVDWAGYIDKQVQSLQEAIKVDSDIRMKKLELERLLTEYRKAR